MIAVLGMCVLVVVVGVVVVGSRNVYLFSRLLVLGVLCVLCVCLCVEGTTKVGVDVT